MKSSSRLPKELYALNDAMFPRIDRKIQALADNPRPAGCKKLAGYKDQWLGSGFGDWRVLHIIGDGTKLVTLTRAAQPREVLRVGSMTRSVRHRLISSLTRYDIEGL